MTRRRELDWSHCPICGAVNHFGVEREGRLYATNRLQPVIVGDELLAANLTVSIPDWTSLITVAYFTTCCRQELPEAYQDALDEILHIVRDPLA